MKTIKKFLTGAFATAMTASVAYTPVLAKTTKKTDYKGSTKDAIVIETPSEKGKWMETAGKYWYLFTSGDKAGTYIHAEAPEETVIYVDINDKAYAFDASGWMLTGWFKDGAGWHFADATGAVKENGWVKWGSNWYFFEYGTMVENSLVVETEAGWTSWYGKEMSRWEFTGSTQNWYYVGEDGKMVTGWIHPDGMEDSWGKEAWLYCLPTNGSVVRSAWLQHGSYWYYLDANGIMVRNTNVGGYWINENGQWLGTQDGWKQNSVGWWYSLDGSYVADKFLEIDGTTYFFNKEGYMITGWAQLGTADWYYFASNGAMQTGWTKIDGDWYYFEKDGKLTSETTKVSEDGGHIYTLENGKLVKTENA